jgi:membrane peptidoglycan carboxypeptidase
MQTDQRSPQSSNTADLPVVKENTAMTVESEGEKTYHRPVTPAKLPPQSRAAASQRLNDIPLEPTRGVYYEASHRQVHANGWHLKRHLKRKNLRLTNLRYLETDQKGTKWGLMPMALGTLVVIFVLTTGLVTFSAINGATQQRYSQDVTTLQDILPKDNLKLYDSKGIPIYQATDQGLQTSVPLSKISKNLINAEVAIEDQYFWTNPGFDITGIIRAALDDMTHNRVVSGGSTITQQLIKNAIVGDQTTAIRKLQEIMLAPAVTRQYSKQQILEMYIDTTYYGEQAYGAEAAAFTYYGLHDTATQTASQQLSIAQAAMLAGIPSSPIARDPMLHPKAALARMQEVLQQMYLQGYITAAQRTQAIEEAKQPNFIKPGVLPPTQAPHFVNYALKELAGELHVKVKDLSRAGLVVSTTLDLKLQNQVLKIAQKHIAELAQVHHMSNAAVVIIDPHNGAIRTLQGNIDPNSPVDGAFDVASQGYRQPGSAFKPFIYATAFEQGVSPGSPVYDGPLTIQMCCGLPAYTPQNYDQSYHGMITYRYALQNSFNIPAVKLLMQTGIDPAMKMATNMGITQYEGTPNYTLVLGALSVRLLDMTASYATFANQGVRIPPHAIDTVKDIRGNTIFHFQPVGKQVITKQAAFMVTNVLSDNNSRTYEFGKCSVLYLYSTSQQQCYAGNPGPVRPAAVKTGTSNDFRDNLTVGYTTDYVVGVWVGNNNNSPMVNVIGVDGAGPIWHDSMELVEKGRPIQSFPLPPSGVVKKTVTYPGLTSTDWYLANKKP